MDFRQIVSIVHQIAKEKNIDPEKVINAIEDSIATGYRREYGERGEVVKAKIDLQTGEAKFWQEKEVVDETTVRIPSAEEESLDEVVVDEKLGEVEEEGKLPRFNEEKHIFLEEAKKINPDINLGDKIEFPLESKIDFGRIAAQAAKQVILQKFREAERDSAMSEFKEKEGKIISGLIHRIEKGTVHIDLGRINGVMFATETIPEEKYPVNQRMRFYVVAVQEDRRGAPQIVLSRSHPKFIAKLFELEVPEIADGIVEIKSIAREAGSRTKMAVVSNTEGVDPVGSCIGQRGTRVMAVTNEVGMEKIDIIEWSENTENFIASSLSPAKVNSVILNNDSSAQVLVSPDQLSLAIGKGGQNVRLAAKLTGWKIDVRSEENPDVAMSAEDNYSEGEV